MPLFFYLLSFYWVTSINKDITIVEASSSILTADAK